MTQEDYGWWAGDIELRITVNPADLTGAITLLSPDNNKIIINNLPLFIKRLQEIQKFYKNIRI